MHYTGRRLIEDLLPIRAVNSEAVREKSLRHGNISTLHPWWARRPIVAARAAVYGALVPAPTNDEERKVSQDLMKKLCRWDFHQDILEQARLDILVANKNKPPRVLDMFTGGGSIPLEALRLGCETYAVDLNPVAYIIELCTLDYPQRYGSSLVSDVGRWGTWVIERAKERLTGFYPPLTSSAFTKNGTQQRSFANGMNADNVEGPLTPIAYLWTRIVYCPKSNCGAIVPLVQQTWLRKRGDNCVALRALPDHTTKSVRFEVVQVSEVGELGFDPGTDNKRHNAVCLHCGAAVDIEYIKTQGQNGNIGQKLMAVVCTQQTSSGKIYLADEAFPNCVDRNELLARADALCNEYGLSLPVEPVPQHLTGGISYGLTRFKDLFTPRQLLSLLAFTIEVRHAYHAMLDDGMEPERAAAITTYLGVMINHLANHNSSICRWDNARETSRYTYACQALPMTWDFAEINPHTEGPNSPASALNWITSTMHALVHSGRYAHVKRASALRLPFLDNTFDAIITDPPYYDNVPYADLSDFFYIWLKRSIGFLYPEHLRTSLAPKNQEVVMTTNSRDQSEKVAKQNYERMMSQAFVEAHRVLKPGAPLVCIYTDKSTWGLTTLIDALRHAGFVIIETWPLDTEMTNRSVAHDRETLTSNIILVARRREGQTTGASAYKVRSSEQTEITSVYLDTLIKEEIVGADLRRTSSSVLRDRDLSTRTRLFFEDLDNFERARGLGRAQVEPNLVDGYYLDRSEDFIQTGLEQILGESSHKKDWGGEENDLYTSTIFIQGRRVSTAFLLKGNGLRKQMMEIADCGKNGDQIMRLVQSPAQLFIIQFVGRVSENIIKDIEGKVELLRSRGKEAWYCVLEGEDIAKIFKAYNIIDAE